MKRVLAAFAVVVALSLSMLGTAIASVSVILAEGRGDLSDDKQSIVVSGSIICTDGNTVSVSVIVAQTSGKTSSTGTGSSGDLTCTGAAQPWVAIVTSVSGGTEFKHGPASLIFGAFDSTDSSSSETHTQSFRL